MRSFTQLLNAIRKSDDVLRAAVTEACTYILMQYHTGGRKVDGANANLKDQLVAACPGWLQKEAKTWHLQSGQRAKDMTEQQAESRAGMMVALAFESQETKRRIAKDQRAAKSAATPKADAQPKAAPTPEATVIEGECEVVTIESASVLVVKGEAIELSAAEADALRDTLMALRAQMMATPLRLAA